MVMGRPKKYRNCLDLDMDAEIYFENCIYEEEGHYIKRETPIPYTITGLAMALNMDRHSLVNYSKDADFFTTIKRHRLMVENFIELRLYGNSVTGLIFNLKNNFGWKDKNETELTGKDGGALETKSTVEAGPGISGVLSKLAEATTTRPVGSDEGGDQE